MRKSNQVVSPDGELITLKQRKHRSPLNFDYRLNKVWKTDKPDMTVPDQSMSIREILEKHSRGLMTGGVMKEIYGGDIGEGINPFTLDMVDIQRLKLLNKEQIQDLTNRAIEEKATRKAALDAERSRQQNEQMDEILKKLEKERVGEK